MTIKDNAVSITSQNTRVAILGIRHFMSFYDKYRSKSLLRILNIKTKPLYNFIVRFMELSLLLHI